MECKDAAAAVIADAGSQDGATFLITQSFFPGQHYHASGSLKQAPEVAGSTYARGVATFSPGTYSLGNGILTIFKAPAVGLFYDSGLGTYLSGLTCTHLVGETYAFHGVEKYLRGPEADWYPNWTHIIVEPQKLRLPDPEEMRRLLDAIS
jgi:hypothetical protein